MKVIETYIMLRYNQTRQLSFKFTFLILLSYIFIIEIVADITPDYGRPLVLLTPSKEAVISARVDSTIIKINIHEGMKVKKGDMALTLDKDQFELDKTVLLKELAKLSTRKNFLDSELKRFTKLIKGSVVSQSAYDNIKNQNDQINEEIKLVEGKLRIAELDISYCKIHVPFDGYITKVITHEHEYLERGNPIFKIICLNPLHVIVNVHESMVNQVKIGQDIDFRLRYSKDILQAKIIQIHPEVDPETKTIKVVAQLKNKNNRLKAGMIGTFLGIPSNN